MLCPARGRKNHQLCLQSKTLQQYPFPARGGEAERAPGPWAPGCGDVSGVRAGGRGCRGVTRTRVWWKGEAREGNVSWLTGGGREHRELRLSAQHHWVPSSRPSRVPWGQQSPAWPRQHGKSEPKPQLQQAGRRCQSWGCVLAVKKPQKGFLIAGVQQERAGEPRLAVASRARVCTSASRAHACVLVHRHACRTSARLLPHAHVRGCTCVCMRSCTCGLYGAGGGG